jgi:hypothetical protein
MFVGVEQHDFAVGLRDSSFWNFTRKRIRNLHNAAAPISPLDQVADDCVLGVPVIQVGTRVNFSVVKGGQTTIEIGALPSTGAIHRLTRRQL